MTGPLGGWGAAAGGQRVARSRFSAQILWIFACFANGAFRGACSIQSIKKRIQSIKTGRRGVGGLSFRHSVILSCVQKKAKSSTNWRPSGCHGARGPEKPMNLRRVSPQEPQDPVMGSGVPKNHENDREFRAQVGHDKMTE